MIHIQKGEFDIKGVSLESWQRMYNFTHNLPNYTEGKQCILILTMPFILSPLDNNFDFELYYNFPDGANPPDRDPTYLYDKYLDGSRPRIGIGTSDPHAFDLSFMIPIGTPLGSDGSRYITIDLWAYRYNSTEDTASGIVGYSSIVEEVDYMMTPA